MNTSDLPAQQPAVIKLNCPSKLVAAVPSLLGYLPSDSLVVLAEDVADDAGMLVLRVDLPAAPAVDEWVAQLFTVAMRSQPTQVSLVCWAALEPPAVVAELPTDRPVRALAAQLASHGVVIEATLTTNGRWIWCHGCSDPECRQGGAPVLPECADEVHAAFQGAEVAVLPSRQAVAALLAPDPELQARVEQELAGCDTSKSLSARDAALAWLSRRWLAEWPSPPSASPGELAALIIALFDRRVRDVLVVRLARASGDDCARLSAAVDDLRAALRGCPRELAAPVASVFGLLVWFGGGADGVRAEPGGGALATEALRIARAADPDYTFAKLVEATIQSGQAPDRWLRGLAEVSESACLSGESGHPGPPGVGRRYRRSA